MNIKQEFRKVKNYLNEPELYMGRCIGLLGGIIAGMVKHYPEYPGCLKKLYSAQNLLEQIKINVQYAAKSLDEIVIGIVLGTVMGAGVNYIKSRRNQ